MNCQNAFNIFMHFMYFMGAVELPEHKFKHAILLFFKTLKESPL